MSEMRLDECGNPISYLKGCPNCGKRAGWYTVIQWAAAGNSGRDLEGPCSRRCELQVEYARSLAVRQERNA